MNPVVELKKRAMAVSREAKLKHFMDLSEDGQSVLDVGVSREVHTSLPGLNYFLKHYPYAADTYTALGVQDIEDMAQTHPGKRFVQYDGDQFPFADKSFDWVFSNAVIEHVGDDDRQLRFLNEMLRVARQVFFTTPNKFFPVESHTNVFFLHWHDDTFYRWCARNRPKLTRDTLNLISGSRLAALMEQSNATRFELQRNRLLGLPMTFTVVCEQT